MPRYIKINEGVANSYPYELSRLVRDFPSTSFVQPFEQNDLAAFGVYPVTEVAMPTHNPMTHGALELAPVLNQGSYLQQWEIYPLSNEVAAGKLAAARAARWEEIKAERARRTAGGVLVAGKWFHTDTPSRLQWLALVLLGAGVPAQPWKTMDNTFISLSQSLVQQVFGAMIAKEQTVFTHAEVLRSQVFGSDSPGSVDITVGWPEIFGGA